jgi:hypothetical protein
VNCLYKCDYLELLNCYGLDDVSELGNIRILLLTNCFQLQNISPLTNNYHIELHSCSGIVKYDSLGNSVVVHLSKQKRVILSVFRLARLLEVKNCKLLKKACRLNTTSLRCLHVHDPPLFFFAQNNDNFRSCQKVNIANCQSTFDLKLFTTVKSLTIQCCDLLTSLSDLSNTNHVHQLEYAEIKSCKNIVDFTPLGRFPHVVISLAYDCLYEWAKVLQGFRFASFQGLQDVKTLEIGKP